MKINYITEDPAHEYAAAIRGAKNVAELVAAIEPFREAAEDALAIAKAMTEDDFRAFVSGTKKQRTTKDEKFIEEFCARFGSVLMPDRMLEATLLSNEMRVPWGLAFIRLNGGK